MALRYIDGTLHETEKVNRGTCTKCGHGICVGWRVSKVIAGRPGNKEQARYCYDCTSNQWAKAFRIYHESLAS